MTGSLLAQAANGLFQTDSSTIAHQEQQQETMSNSNGLEAISSSLDSIALTGQLEGERPSTLAGIGDPNGLSTKAPAGVAAACGQILTAALPSFIPSMVTPLVCVFSYQTPPISELAPISYTRHHQPDTTASSSTSSSSSIKKVEESAQKEFVYPWGHPNEPSPLPSISHSSQYKQNHPSAPSLPHSTTPSSLSPPSSSSSSSSSSPSPDYKSRKKRALVASVPDSGIVVFHSKTWTEHEREALYLAATRFRLCGQWSKIREMMNLHRTDQEIEAEYMKLYSHRDNDSDDDTLDDEKNDYYCIKPSIVDALTRERINHDDENDIDADDERDTEVFIKFGGHASALNRRQQSQYLQSKNMHIDQAYHPPQDQGQQQYQDNVPPHQNTRYHQQQSPQAMQQQQQQELESCPTDKNPWKLYKNELLIDKRFVLEDIPMRI
ncbi:hypothetical protein FBU30_009874 [Linnemannia zychae]|nr:hypothetical protein FBU30_009874 [Linnemannia zychae]